MQHPITDLRQAAAAVLKQRFARVYADRTVLPAQSQLPCVLVYIDGRSSSQSGIDILRHDVQLVVLLCVQGGSAAETVAEKMLRETETLFYRHPDLNTPHRVESLLPERLAVSIDSDGETATVYYQQTWRLVYFETLPSE